MDDSQRLLQCWNLGKETVTIAAASDTHREIVRVNEKQEAKVKVKAKVVNLKVASQVSQKEDQKADQKEEAKQEARTVESPRPGKAREEHAGHVVRHSITHTIVHKHPHLKVDMEVKHSRWPIIGQKEKVIN